MSQKRLSCLELKIMEALWKQGTASVREIIESGQLTLQDVEEGELA